MSLRSRLKDEKDETGRHTVVVRTIVALRGVPIRYIGQWGRSDERDSTHFANDPL